MLETACFCRRRKTCRIEKIDRIEKQYLSHVNLKQDRFGLLEFVMGDTPEQFLEDAKELHRLLRQVQP